MAVKDWSTTAASNTAIFAGISTDGTVMTVSQVDNAFREMAAQIASQLGKMGFEGADIASATTTNLANATGWSLDITGTTTITSFGTVDAGQVFILRFTGALTLTHNATSLILPEGVSITTAANDVAIMKSEGSGNWRCLNYQRAVTVELKAGSGTVTTSTTAKQLQAVGSSVAGVLIENTSATGSGFITFGDGAIAGRIAYDHSTDEMTGTVGAAALWTGSATAFNVGKTGGSVSVAGATLYKTGLIQTVGDGIAALEVYRHTNDGAIANFGQGGTVEGSISVSGTTISYNAFMGSHWSQLADGSKPDILPGTVCETIDQMAAWPNETNNRLAKFKISDTAGSKSVYGVFSAWDNDDTRTNDAYIAALGAYVVRVAPGVTVQNGDLLESNGDGCARVQSDGIFRASTIAKVAASVVVETYPDGSYLVPATLHCG